MSVLGNPTLISGAGYSAGRIDPVNYEPASGVYVYCVGSDAIGRYDTVAVGDLAGLEQVVDFTSLTLLHFAVALRQTEASTAGARRALATLYPVALADGEDLRLKVDGGAEQSISFLATDTTLSLVTARILAGLSGATCVADNGQPKITSNTLGSGSSIEITGGTARAKLGFAIGSTAGEYVSFTFKVQIDGTTYYTLQPAAGAVASYVRRTINVRALTGSLTLRFILEATS